MHLQFLWEIIQDTYIFIILAWLIAAIILRKTRHYKTYLTVSAVVYILILLYVTLLGRTARTEYNMELSFLWEYRLALSGHTDWWIQIFDNIMLFVPMGWLYGSLKCGVRGNGTREPHGELTFGESKVRGAQWLKAAFFGLCASSIIEICQLVFRLGLFEFDDILNNTVGMTVGYGLYHAVGRARKHSGHM